MNSRYDKWEKESGVFKSKLEDALNRHGGSDVVVSYHDIAYAFPSRAPNPFSFEYPLIEQELFSVWCIQNEWEFNIDREAARDCKMHARIRLTRSRK